MIEVKFYDYVEDSLLRFAVIVAKYKGKWAFCKHKDRDTYEVAVVTEKKMRVLLKQQKENYMKKPEHVSMI